MMFMSLLLFPACDHHEVRYNFNTKKANAEIVKIIPITGWRHILSVNSLFFTDSGTYIDHKYFSHWIISDIENDKLIDKQSFYYDVKSLFQQTDDLRHNSGSCMGIMDVGEKYIFLRLLHKQVLRPRLDYLYWEDSAIPCFFEIGHDGSNLCLSDITNDLPNADSITSMYYDHSQKILYTVHSDDTLSAKSKEILPWYKYHRSFGNKQILSVYNYDYESHSCSLIRSDIVDDDYRLTNGGGYIYKEYEEENDPYTKLRRIFWYKDYTAENPHVITLNYILNISWLFFGFAFYHDGYLWVELSTEIADSTSDYNLLKLRLLDDDMNSDCYQPECAR